MASTDDALDAAKRRATERKLDAAGWGLFFIWAGVALLAHFGWPVGLLGVGAIILCTQIARKYLGLKVDGFWVVVGSIFLLGGTWEWFQIQIGLVPILCIAAGVALLASALASKPRD